MAKMLLVSVFLAAALLFAGCSQPSGYVNPDEPDRLGGTGIDSQDARTVAQEMSRDLAGSAALSRVTGKPVIALLPVRNDTRFRQDVDMITLQIRNSLIQHAGDRMTFVQRERLGDIRAERDAKRAGDVSASGEQMISGADYFLTGTIKSISKSAGSSVSDYLYYSFELIDAESSNVVWAKDYDAKKVGTRGVLYR